MNLLAFSRDKGGIDMKIDSSMVGKKVRAESWICDFWVKVLCVGENIFFGVDNKGYESAWDREDGLNAWQLYEEPAPIEMPDSRIKRIHIEVGGKASEISSKAWLALMIYLNETIPPLLEQARKGK